MLILISTAAMVGIYYTVDGLSKSWFIGEHLWTGTFIVFAVMYSFFYLMLIIRTFRKYQKTLKIFNMSNLKMIIFGMLLWYPLSYQVNVLWTQKDRMAAMLEPSACGNPDSPLSRFEKLYEDGSGLLCSTECPCSGNPKLFEKEPVHIIEDGSKCPDNKNCLYFDYTSEMYDAQRCYEKQEEKLTKMDQKYMRLMFELERAYDCSGSICDPDSKLPFYVFSNINNGIPKTSCYEPLKNKILGEFDKYLFAFSFSLAISVIVVSVYFFIFVVRIYKYCRKQCLKNKMNQERMDARRERE
jgi:hypothetical protein